MTPDNHINLAATAIGAASQTEGRVRSIHLAVARTSLTTARRRVEELESLLKAAEGQLAIDYPTGSP
jgi:hypothetical protein